MPNTMIERVSRVLCEQAGQDPDSHAPEAPQRSVQAFGQGKHRPRWREYRGHAGMIIAAMREPTSMMLEEAYSQSQDVGVPTLSEAWRAMIDAALNEDSPSISR